MHTDNDRDPNGADTSMDGAEDLQDSTLNWLLDMDMSEPEERLFSLEAEAYVAEELSDFEAEFAARPMTRGKAGADDLDTYVNEEIVISSGDQPSDIYSANPVSGQGPTDGAEMSDNESMAIDYSRSPSQQFSSSNGGLEASLTEGLDILGLSADDDMGEKFLIVNRAKAEEDKASAAQDRPPVSDTRPPVDEAAKPPVSDTKPPVDEVAQPQTLLLSQAPALRLVDAASDHVVANEASQAEEVNLRAGHVDLQEEAPVDEPRQGVNEYMASVQLPADEQAFDQYLLGGEQLEDSSCDFSQLLVEHIDGVVPVDTSPDVAIDYHEDFRSMPGFDGSSVAAIMPLLAPLEEQVAALVAARLDALHLPADSVLVELMLGSDDESVRQCRDGGYESLVSICVPPPVALQQLQQSQVDTIFARLVHEATGNNWNSLFNEGFTVTAEAGNAESPALTMEVAESEDCEEAMDFSAALDDVESSFSFEALGTGAAAGSVDPVDATEAAFLAELLDEAETMFLAEPVEAEEDMGIAGAEDVPEIVAVTDTVASVAGDSASVQAAPEIFSPQLLAGDLDEALRGEDWEPGDTDIDEIFADFGGPGFGEPSESEPSAADEVMLAATEAPWAAEAEQLQVFEEDIFATDLEGELAATSNAAPEHIEALFESFGEMPDDGGEICGLDVDEFSVTADAAESLDKGIEVELVNAPAEAGSSVNDSSWFIPDGIAFSYASPTSAEIFGDFLDAFIEEGSSELEKLEDAICTWEKEINSESAYVTVTRILHTIKGIAKGVGLQYYGSLIHNFETLLEALPKPEADQQSDYFRIVNVWLDAAVRGLDYVQGERADIVSEFPQVGGASVPVEQAGVESVEEVSQVVPDSEPVATAQEPENKHQKRQSRQVADEGAKVLAAQQSVRITSDKLDHMLNLANQAQQLGVRTAQSTARGKRASAEMQTRLSSVRAHIASIADKALRNVTALGVQAASELDALEMDQYSELQEAANILREGVEDLADLVDFASRQNAQIEALLKQQANVISSIGSSIRAARVVPVSRLIPGLRRLVRTVSTELSKAVSLQVLNELGTLDRDDFGRCQTILDHMVRNALDHGIETAAEREAAGKPANGRVTVDIRKSGADAIITLSDDGRGINPEAMRDSACKKGLDIDVDSLSDEEAIRLIFHKGFSTASTVSQISGRGVGMDIVLSELQQMGGDIQIESTLGKGTSFHIRIPSSVTVNGALLVAAGDQSYAIPLGGLIAVERVPVDDFYTAVEGGTTLSLSALECEPAYLATLCQGEPLPEKKVWGGSVPVILAGEEGHHLAIAVDDVEEALELVIRSLGVQFSSVPGVAGAATTADGEAIVALDLNLLAAGVGAEDHSPVSVGAEREDTLLAMVVDDSRTQRMVATSQLETVGVETITAENGGVAIDLLNTAERIPDIILLDVEMPVKDGIQTLREIRRSVRYSHVPVIMVTSRTGLKHRALAEEAGCNGYMGKPFNFRMLVWQINELTGHRLQLS